MRQVLKLTMKAVLGPGTAELWDSWASWVPGLTKSPSLVNFRTASHPWTAVKLTKIMLISASSCRNAREHILFQKHHVSTFWKQKKNNLIICFPGNFKNEVLFQIGTKTNFEMSTFPAKQEFWVSISSVQIYPSLSLQILLLAFVFLSHTVCNQCPSPCTCN